jgi:hypothetical protein
VFLAYSCLRHDACLLSIHKLCNPGPKDYTFQHHHVWLFGCALLHFNFHHGDLIRWLGGEYTNGTRDGTEIFHTLDVLRQFPPLPGHPLVDIDRAYRIVTEGAPLADIFECDYATVTLRNQYDNHPPLQQVLHEVRRKLLEEEALTYHILLPHFLWCFIPGLHLSMMTWHVRKGKGCLIVDPSSAIDGGLVREKNDRTLEARATHFSTWLSRNGYTYQSPASLSPGAGIATLGLFLMSVATGDNIHQCSNLCTKTLAGYLRAASAYLEDVTHQTIPLYNEHKTVHPLLAEVLAQRAAWREPLSKKEPLTSTTLHHMHHITQHAFQQDQTSFLDKSAALLDWI